MRPLIQPQLLLIGLLGFFSGLPLALTASTLTAWLADAKVERASIGLFAAIATPYALKFLWAPLLDGLRLPILSTRLGRRRGWLVLTQLLLAASIAAMAFTNPAMNPWMTALVGVIIASLSATQDTVIDAYRVERLPAEQQGSGAAWATFGYRIGMLISGAGALYLADHVGWRMTYLVMAAIMATSMIITLLMRESSGISAELAAKKRNLKGFLRDYVVAPFRDFMTRPMWLQVLAFVILYKLGDAFMGVMFNPFLLDIGFSKTQIAQVVKFYGLIATILGTFAGGWLVGHAGMFRALLLCGFCHMLTNLLLVMQARIGADVHFLTFSISLENFTGGMSTAAFIAYLSALCRLNYTATQYALLSSFAAFGRTWLSTPSGALAASVGWEMFFLISSLMSIPSLMLLIWLERKKKASTLQA
jgi:MFS transporter, PAT family, beta-lactamase induction signal transducer AmpG